MKKSFAAGFSFLPAVTSVLAAAGTLLLSTAAFAHPGHHGSDWLQAVIHMLTEPDHLASILLAVGVAVLVWRSVRRKPVNNKDTDRGPL